MITTLNQVKLHLRLSSVDTTEDSLLQLYMSAADDYISNVLDTVNPPNNPSVRAAALLIIGGLYENRESHTADVVIKENPTVLNLLYPYRKLGV
jgi:uncharacterized phage protein (predicted DNA packaging)